MLLILGSIEETSLNNMYVRKPIKEEYTFETETTKLLLSQCVQKTLPNQLHLSPLQVNPLTKSRGGKNEGHSHTEILVSNIG